LRNNISSPLKIAVTGGIGSGKSVFCKILEEKGFLVIKADPLAKELMNSDTWIRKAIIKIFGNEVYPDGKLDSSYLAKKIFTDPENVKKINSIVHPVVISKIKEAFSDSKDRAVFVEAALIFEAKMEKMFDHVVLVTAFDEIRIERTIKRDGSSREEVIKRIQNQLPDEKKKGKSHYVFQNNGTIEELNSKVELLLKILSLS